MKKNINSLTKILFSKLDTRKLLNDHYKAVTAFLSYLFILIPLCSIEVYGALDYELHLTSIIGNFNAAVMCFALTGLIPLLYILFALIVSRDDIVNDIPYLT